MADEEQKIELGDLVRYNNALRFLTSVGGNDPTGIVKEIKGKNWVIVQWADSVTLDEHVDDLILISKRSR